MLECSSFSLILSKDFFVVVVFPLEFSWTERNYFSFFCSLNQVHVLD